MPDVSDQSPEELDRRKRLAGQANEQYLALGRFIAKLELLSQALRMGIERLLSRGGLHDQQRAQIVVADLMAENLRQIFFSLLAHDVGRAGVKADLFDDVWRRIERLTQQRNLLVHNPMFIGWASEVDQDLGPARGFRLRRPKSGPGVQELVYSTAELLELGDEADRLTALVHRLWGILYVGSTFESNFTRLDDGTWLPKRPGE